MRIIYSHLLDSLDDVTASSEVTNHEGSNVQNQHMYNTWRTTSDTSENIVFDFGAATSVNCVVISNHNLTNAATIKFQMHTADAWGAPDLDETLTWREGHIIHYFTSTSKRYCRFTFVDAANPDGYIEIGRLTASVYLQVSPSSLADYSITNNPSDIIHRTPSNNQYSYNIGSFRTFSYKFPRSSNTMINSIQTVWDTVGRHTPFFLDNMDGDYDYTDPAYCVLLGPLTEKWNGHRASYDISAREIGNI